MAELADLAPVGAEVAHVIIVSQSGDVLLAVELARDGIQGATQQMRLLAPNKSYRLPMPSIERAGHYPSARID